MSVRRASDIDMVLHSMTMRARVCVLVAEERIE